MTLAKFSGDLRPNTGLTFPELIEVREIVGPATHDDGPARYYQSITFPFVPPYSPGSYGGHVLAQSLWAASLTTPEGFCCHSHQSLFLLPGHGKVPFIYRIQVLRQGRSFLSRRVNVYQFPRPEWGEFRLPDKFSMENCVFVADLSFKKPEPKYVFHELPLDPKLMPPNKAEMDKIPLAPDIDVPNSKALMKMADFEPLEHPLETRKLDMEVYNDGKEIHEMQQVQYMRSLADFPANPNLTAAGLIYTSDRNSLFIVTNFHKANTWGRIASISHTFIMHDFKHLITKDHWMTMTANSDSANDQRCLYQGRIYASDGHLVCSFMQDGLLRGSL